MRIPSDSPVTINATRPSVLQSLALRSGQTFTAQVISNTPDGLTQLQVGNQQISLALPKQPQVGAILEFQVRGSGANQQLVLLRELPPRPVPAQAGNPPPPQTGSQTATNAPASNTSQAPQTSQLTSTAPNQNAPTQPASVPQTNSPAPPANSSSIPNASSTPAPPSTAPSNVSIPLPANVRTALALQPGQTVTAQITGTAPNGQTQFTIGQHQFSASIPNAPPTGTQLQLQVQIAGAETRLVLTQNSATPGQPPQDGTAKPAIASTPAAGRPALPQWQSPHQAQATQPSFPPGPVQQAVVQATPTALVQQDSVGKLLATLTGLQSQETLLPAPIAAAGRSLLGKVLNLSDGLPRPEALQQAVVQSGIFMEATLASGTPASAITGDMKALLFLLRGVLSGWLGEDGGQAKTEGNKLPPPARGGLPRSPNNLNQTLPEGVTSRDAGRALLSQTDAALSRVRLFQLSSLPEGGARTLSGAPQEWNLEIPIMFGGELNVAQFQISRDGQSDDDDDPDGWHMRFSMNFQIVGEVGAHVSYRAGKVGAMIWAENEQTADMLQTMLPELISALDARGLEPGAIVVRRGPPEENNAKPAGGFMDATS